MINDEVDAVDAETDVDVVVDETDCDTLTQ